VHQGTPELLVKWKGFEDEEQGWERLDIMKEDIPVMVSDFLDEIKASGTNRQRKIVATLI